MSTANKILMGASGAGGPVGPSDDEFNRVSFLSHFDGANNGVNNVFDDGSASNHTITANGDVTQGSFGPFARPDGEWGVSFDGSGDRVRANWAENVGTSDFTIEAWVFVPSNMDQYDCIAWLQESLHSNASENGFFIRANSSNTIEFAVLSGFTIYNAVSSAISFNEWHHLSISKSGTTMYYSVDGTVANRSAPSGINDSDYLNIGAADANGSLSYPFKGLISNVRFLIGTALYTSSFTPSTSSLTAITNTKFLGCQSNRFVDNSSNGYTITPSGNPAVSAFGPFLTSSVYDAAVNGASSTGGYVAAATSTDWQFGSGDFTVEFWTYPLGTGSWVIAHGVGDVTGSAISWQYGYGTFDFYYGSSSVQITSPTLTLNSWQYITVVRNGATITAYKDGVSTGTANIGSNSLNTGGTSPFYVGAYPNAASSNINGYLSDVRVVKGTAVYTSNFTPPTAPLSAITNTKLLLNMADGQAIDSAAQNNITLGGNANTSTDQAKFGNTSLHLDGTTDYAEIVNVQGFGTGDFTIEGFYRFASFTSQGDVFDFRTALNSALPLLYLNSSGELKYYLSGAVRISAGSGNELSTNTWYHIALCRGSGSTKLFVDGTQVGSTYSDSITYLTAPIVRIGARSYGATPDQNIDGFVDDFRISHMARYTSNFTAPTAAFADKGQ